MNPRTYRPRIADSQLAARLRRAGAVLVEGPKSCGKTAMALQVAGSVMHVDIDAQVAAAMEVDPALTLVGDVPRLLDEWQVQPRLWDYVRREVDARGLPGQFILTGSSTPRSDIRRHSGAGRFSRLALRTMSLYETGESTGQISLAALFDGQMPHFPDGPLTIQRLSRLIVRGGWPLALNLGERDAADCALDYLELLIDTDIPNVAGGGRDPERLRRLMRSLARNTASEAAITTIATDIVEPDQTSAARETIREYLAVLERLMIIEDQPAWSPALRSRARLRRSAKRHLADVSLACAALRATPQRLLADLNTFGVMFESLAVHELRVYAEPMGGAVYHYRDSNGHEADAIVELPDGRWLACEVKLGTGSVDQAARSLRTFAEQVDTAKLGEPAMLVVVAGTGMAYRRSDGVCVVPIGMLGP